MAHTPGPWAWFGNAKNNEVYLATENRGRRYVMGFERWGMRGAQPRFQPDGRGLVSASELLTFEVGNRAVRGVAAAKADESVYRLDVKGIDCADAQLIAASPDLVEALITLVEQVEVNGDWDDGCFYYKGTSAPELQDPLLHARAAIAKATGATPETTAKQTPAS